MEGALPSRGRRADRRTARRGADQRRVRRLASAGSPPCWRCSTPARPASRWSTSTTGTAPGVFAARVARQTRAPMTARRDSSGSTPRRAPAATCCSARWSAPASRSRCCRRPSTRSSPEPVALRVETGHAAAASPRPACHVEVADSDHHRTWRDVRALLGGPTSPTTSAPRRARLRAARRRRGGRARHRPRRGALPRGRRPRRDRRRRRRRAPASPHLGARRRSSVSPVAVGSGTVRGAHGTLPVPPPAVAELLRGVPSYAGPAGAPAMELCTPTGAALLTTLATAWGPQPAMTVDAIGVGAGGRDPEGHANVVRLFGSAAGLARPPDDRRRPAAARVATSTTSTRGCGRP